MHVVLLDPDGSAWQELDGGAWGLYPAEDLGAAGTIEGRRVPCITAALQVRHHLGYPPMADDLHDMRALAVRLGATVPPGWR